MKRLLLPLILVILITAVVFVSCSKEDTTPTTEPETVTEEENTPETSTSSTTKKPIPTFKTAATEASTEFKGTPVIYPTTSTTTKAATTTTTKAATTTTTVPAVTTTEYVAPSHSTEQPGQQPEYTNRNEIVLPMDPVNNTDSATEFGSITLIKWLG